MIYYLKQTVFISRGFQNGWTFKMVVLATGCALAVDHAFNFDLNFLKNSLLKAMNSYKLIEYRVSAKKMAKIVTFQGSATFLQLFVIMDSTKGNSTLC